MRLLVDGLAYGLSPYGGLITFWDELLPRLDERGVDITLAVPDRLRAAPPKLRATTSGPADAFVSTYYTLPVRRETPSLVVLHDVLYEADPERLAKADDPLLIDRKTEALAHARSVVCPSQATKDAASRCYPGLGPCQVIPHGINPVFKPAFDQIADQRATRVLGDLSMTSPFLLHVGGRQGYKNFLSVLEAFSLDREIDGRLSLLAVGSEPERVEAERDLLNRIRPDRVAFAGYVEQRTLAALYRRATGVVCPSQGEGFGFVPVEAIACGATVVCTDIAAHRETVGGAATFYTPGEVSSLARALQVATAPADSVVASVRENHSWDRAAEEFISALSCLIQRLS